MAGDAPGYRPLGAETTGANSSPCGVVMELSAAGGAEAADGIVARGGRTRPSQVGRQVTP